MMLSSVDSYDVCFMSRVILCACLYVVFLSCCSGYVLFVVCNS